MDVVASSFLDELGSGPHADAPRVTRVRRVGHCVDPLCLALRLLGESPEVFLAPHERSLGFGLDKLSTDSVSGVLVAGFGSSGLTRAHVYVGRDSKCVRHGHKSYSSDSGNEIFHNLKI